MLVLRSIRSLLVGLMVVGALTLVPSTAQAAPSGLRFCLNDNYSGFCDTRQGYDANFGNDHWCYYNGYFSCTDRWRWGNVDDSISSLRNYTNRWWKLYEHKNYGGYTLCLRPYGRDNNIGNNTPVEDDISSVKKFGTSRPSGCDKVIG